MKKILAAAVILSFFVSLFIAADAKAAQEGRRPGRGPRTEAALPPEVAVFKELSVILGRPTGNSVTVSVLSGSALEAFIEYGREAGKYTFKTETILLKADTPAEFLLDKLEKDTKYFYRLESRKPENGLFKIGDNSSFHTQRTPGSSFIFEMQGDSHPERPQMFLPELYSKTLRAATADLPDFYLTMGDDFSVDTLSAVDAASVKKIYLRQRYYLSLIGHSAPIFLVNGNHEQAAGYLLDGTDTNAAVLAGKNRNTYFPLPETDGFYSGDREEVKYVGLLHDYYSWTWGDALFVTLDPYWHSKVAVDNVMGGWAKRRDLWQVTLGDEQYRWFKKTLEESKAKYKFVFAHHVLGTGRGGIEIAGQFEWGGKNRKGEDEFAQKRPGWELPIHQLMVKNGVTIFFQGHDHIFCRQELDGITYQEVPVPAAPDYNPISMDNYTTGDKFNGSGRVRVSVNPERVKVEYVRSHLEKDATPGHPDGEIAFSYELPAKKGSR